MLEQDGGEGRLGVVGVHRVVERVGLHARLLGALPQLLEPQAAQLLRELFVGFGRLVLRRDGQDELDRRGLGVGAV